MEVYGVELLIFLWRREKVKWVLMVLRALLALQSNDSREPHHATSLEVIGFPPH